MNSSNDVASLTVLGKRLLVGEGVPVSIDKGIAILHEASARGGGEAASVLSVCAAWGVGQSRNIEAALDHVGRAAQLGWEPARRELELLARDSAADPAALRRQVDLASWRLSPAARVQFEKPRICARRVENLLGKPEPTRSHDGHRRSKGQPQQRERRDRPDGDGARHFGMPPAPMLMS